MIDLSLLADGIQIMEEANQRLDNHIKDLKSYLGRGGKPSVLRRAVRRAHSRTEGFPPLLACAHRHLNIVDEI